MYARDNVVTANDVQQILPGNALIEAAATALALLGDATRLRLMIQLSAGGRDVSTLTAAVGAARPAVSQHLAKLRLAGLVTMRRNGRRAVYAVADEHVRRLVAEAVNMTEHRLSDWPDHHLPRPR
jgi:DNA-binding transcriptional ArsR family regulator